MKVKFWIGLFLCILIAALVGIGAMREKARVPRKEATPSTKEANAQALEALPFADKQDFVNAKRGFIAPLPNRGVIKDDQGRVVWDANRYRFLAEDSEAPDTVHPGLWRQGQLLTHAGLYKVVDGIYQVRGADLSNMTIIEGNSGIIVVDPLLSKSTAQAALKLYYQHRPEKPVAAVIYTHSHADHFGGVKGVVSIEDVESGKVRIYAPQGFTQAAITENVMAGTNMSRRSTYMYGTLLPTDPKGQVSAGLGLNLSSGEVTFIEPTDEIKKPVEEVDIDGIKFVFMLAPNTEAPAEMLFYLPQFQALGAAEDAVHTFHNLYTLRGAKVRDSASWAHYLNKAIDRFGKSSEVVFAQHHWPIWGQDQVMEFLEKQRDLYKYVHDQTLRLANHGYNMIEAAEIMTLPDSLSKEWYNRGYYGSLNHNTKAVWNFYLGWFNSNPANLHPLPPVEAGKRYVEIIGGEDKVLEKANEAYDNGDYRWVAEIVNHVVFANPANQEARDLLADAYEQLGYQSENGTWRNHYLMGAMELREGIERRPTANTVSRDVLNAIPPDILFEYLAIRLNGPKAAGHVIKLNLNVPDVDEQHVLFVKNGVLHHVSNQQADDADATITITRSKLNEIFGGETTIAKEISSGDVEVTGNSEKITRFFQLLDTFDFWWNVVTPRSFSRNTNH
ncbi:MAG: alkyl sulfatase dimerization domain-containing protein [Waddliaceae bacterium]